MGLFGKKEKKTGDESAVVPARQTEDILPDTQQYDDRSIQDTALLQSGIGLIGQGLDLANNIVNVYQRSLEIDRDIQMIHATKDVELKKLAAQYELCKEVIQGTFGQREKGLQAHYQVLERALESNDREMIVASLKGISSIVVTNPLESFSNFIEAWNNKDKPLELDF